MDSHPVARLVAGSSLTWLLCLTLVVAGSAQSNATPPAQKAKPSQKAKPVQKSAPAPAKAPEPAPESRPTPTDIKIRTRYTTGAEVSETTTSFKGTRQRVDFPGIASITQCDLRRTVQVNDASKRFIVQAHVEAQPQPGPKETASPAPGAASQGKGGVITYTITTTDTGERKPVFGLEARRINVVTVRQASATGCDKRSERTETDSWYVDLPNHAQCPTSSAPQPVKAPDPGGAPACTDRIETVHVGDAKLGFAVSSNVTTTEEGKEVSTVMMEVTDLQITTLDAALFEVPAGYSEVKSYGELLPAVAGGGSLADALFGSIAAGTKSIAPKRPGAIRIGVVEPGNKSSRSASAAMMREALTAGLSRNPVEALPLVGGTPGEIERDARQKECDYLLVSELAELKSSKPNKVGGLLRRVSGDATAPADVHDARVDFKLFALDNRSSPRLAGSAKASSGGGFGVGSALKLAAFAGSVYMQMAPMMMMGPYLSLSGMSGLGPGAGLPGLVDPGMGAAMSMLSHAQTIGTMAGAGGLGGAETSGGEGAALQTVNDALSKAAKGIVEELKKTKTAS